MVGGAPIVTTTVALRVAMVPSFDTTRALATRIGSGELTLGPEPFTELHVAVTEVTGPATLPGAVSSGSWPSGTVHAWLAGRDAAS